MDSEDQGLVLSTFDIGAPPKDRFGEGPTLTEWLNTEADDEQLHALAQHLEVLDNEGEVTVETPDNASLDALFVFASHLSKERRFLGEVAEELKRFHVEMFVAHDSIPMDAPWGHQIVEALNRCHAGAVFIHPGLHESFYCMQEVGWMLGRGVPIARLMFGESPKGLLGKLQGRPLVGRKPNEVGAAILDWAVERNNLTPNLAESLTLALHGSRSFRHTDAVWSRLKNIPELSLRQLERVLLAAELNGQVYGAGEGGWSGRAYREAIAERAEVWDSDGTLAARIAVLREDHDGPILPPETPTKRLKKSSA